MLDTDICSYVMKRSSQRLVERLSEVPVTEVGVSVVTKAELLYGVRVSPHPARDGEALKALLSYVAVLDFPEAAAEDYADIRADLKRQGKLIGANDLLIAAHARSLDLTLVTNNTAEFSRVKGLDLENWVE
ncbi:MAG: type II toxin-antitoxin system VapC family toxin [Gemmatimonadota bacterium]|jgi:tRNA(fMet)-specific endonuclease VapC